MHITHVVRGSEYLSSTPKYNLLYKHSDGSLLFMYTCPPLCVTHTISFPSVMADKSFEDFGK